MNERYTVDDTNTLEDKVQTFECHTLHDHEDDTFYILLDNLENVQALADKLNNETRINTDNETKITPDHFLHERYMVDDAGTLIDKQTGNIYDYVEELLPLLNAYHRICWNAKTAIACKTPLEFARTWDQYIKREEKKLNEQRMEE